MNEATAIEPRIRELLGGAAALRILVVVWSVAVAVVDARSGVLDHRSAAFALLSVLVAWTGTFGIWAMTAPERLLHRAAITFDLVVAASLVVADWFVYDGSHPQSFGSAWPATAVVVVAVVHGWKVGLAVGSGMGVLNVVAALLADRATDHGLALGGTLVLLATTGTVAGWVSTRLRVAESEVAAARERERFARSLHDGVLQTLAVVQRRSDDVHLVDLARDQELELRQFIGSGPAARGDVVAELRSVAAQAERRHRQRVELVVIEATDVAGVRLDALIGAATEAVTNAAKHGAPTVVTICVDAGDDGAGTSVTIVDDGTGFDLEKVPPGTGVTRSIHARLDEVGGRSKIRSSVGRGTEVALWVP